jgi:hypothetical protein
MNDYYQGEELLKEVRSLRAAVLTWATLWLSEQPGFEHDDYSKNVALANVRVAMLYEAIEKGVRKE